jgi:hypothetical protein
VDYCPREVVDVSLLNPNVTTLFFTMLSSIFVDKANTWVNVGELSLMRVTSCTLSRSSLFKIPYQN